ncbi:MAG: L-glutamate gamma-semialdehyde dehydrogenase [Bdellovibrionia bacterium]
MDYQTIDPREHAPMTVYDPQRDIRAKGQEIFNLMEEESGSIFNKDWWYGRLMDWSMKNEHFKTQMFRFVDVLPYLKSSNEVARHLKEYFAESGDNLPGVMSFGVGVGQLMPPVLATVVRKNVTQMAKMFIAGSDPRDAMPVLEKNRSQKIAFTVDLLGEATLSEKEALEYQHRYIDLIRWLARHSENWKEIPQIDRDSNGPLPKVNVSVKVSALFSQINLKDWEGTKTALKARLRPVFDVAMESGVFINLDMEQYSYKNLTLEIFRELLLEPKYKTYPHWGIVIQGYLRDSASDIDSLVAFSRERGTSFTVRLVKGAYWDYETVDAAQKNWPIPVYTDKRETDANFELCTFKLLQNHKLIRPAIASHNVRSIAACMTHAKNLGVAPNDYEIQMLHGMAEPIKRALVKMGVRIRQYTPIGELIPGMAYLVRRLLENTSNESFLRSKFAENVSNESLLEDPSALVAKKKNANGDSAYRKGNGVHIVTGEDDLSRRSFTAGAGSAKRTSGDQAIWQSGNPSLAPGNWSETDSSAWAEEHGTSTSPLEFPMFKNEALLDFTLPENRTNMLTALKNARAKFGQKIPAVIGGKNILTGKTLNSVNPANPSEIVGVVTLSSTEEAERAVVIAAEEFKTWKQEPIEKRAKILERAADIMNQRRFELCAAQVLEVGKNWSEADGDVCEAIDFLRYYAIEMRRLAKPRRVGSAPGEVSLYHYQARGVALVIAPWNFPLAILTGMVGAALVAGNTVVMKPAEQSSVVAHDLIKILLEAGVPPGAAHFVPGLGEEVGEYLVNNPQISLIAFTGSKEVGLNILNKASQVPRGQNQVKRCIIEMGGKNAIIVDSDADLDEAVLGVMYSAFGFQGQKCSACSRVIVVKEIYERFLDRLVEATRSIKIAPSEDPSSYVGAVIDEAAQKKMLKTIDENRSKFKIAFQGEVPSTGYFVPPTIFADVTPRSSLAQEEIFGPVLAVIKANNIEDAIEIANDTQFGLTGGIYSRSPATIEHVKMNVEVGNFYVNRPITGAIVERHPFGGFKLSGVGSKTGGPDYLQQFMEPRCITENTLRRGFAPAEATDAV